MDEINSPDEIQFRMSELRRVITRHVRVAARDAQDWFDWRQQIARHPIASIALAAAIGFALVPRRKRSEPHAETPSNGHVAHKGFLNLTVPKVQPSLMGPLLRGVISTGISIAINRAIRSLSHQAASSILSHRDVKKTHRPLDERTTQE